jgi:hypothetical protein
VYSNTSSHSYHANPTTKTFRTSLSKSQHPHASQKKSAQETRHNGVDLPNAPAIEQPKVHKRYRLPHPLRRQVSTRYQKPSRETPSTYPVIPTLTRAALQHSTMQARPSIVPRIQPLIPHRMVKHRYLFSRCRCINNIISPQPRAPHKNHPLPKRLLRRESPTSQHSSLHAALPFLGLDLLRDVSQFQQALRDNSGHPDTLKQRRQPVSKEDSARDQKLRRSTTRRPQRKRLLKTQMNPQFIPPRCSSLLAQQSTG